MRKRILLLITAVIFILALSGCQCKHQWEAATCETPKTCTKCEEVEGSSLGHDWEDATCYTAKTCKTCGLISGEPLEHAWAEASCTAAKTCSACGETEGEPLEHTWAEANYQQPQTCSVCGITEGTVKPAVFEEAGIAVQPVEVGKEYSLTAGDIPFAVCLDSSEMLESTEAYESLEGYEWRKLTVRIAAKAQQEELGENVPLYVNFVDYYDPETFYGSMKTLREELPMVIEFAANFSGTDYPKCILVNESSQIRREEASDENPEGTWELLLTVSIRLPADYDGMLLCVGDGVRLYGEYEENYEKLFMDENTVFLRLN